MNNYDWLIQKLDAFIRKYYANQVIRGSLIFLSCLLFYILTVSVSEYFLYLPVWLKISLVSAFILFGASALIIWVIIPLSKMAKLGKVISHEQAAQIVGKHFPEISDRLLNILQLKRQSDSYSSRDLIAASIDQKAAQIAVVPIASAVDFSKNKKYLPYLLPLVLVAITILVAAPSVFSDASERLLQPTKEFVKPAPFQFIVQNKDLKAVRNTDFTLKVKVQGDALPADMAVVLNDDKVSMRKEGMDEFVYTFKNVTEETNFRLYAAGFYSTEYKLKVAQKPVLKAFRLNIDYPDYTGKKDERRTSLGDMVLPVGTRVTWSFNTEHTDNAWLKLGTGTAAKLKNNDGAYSADFRFLSDTTYTFILQNKKSAVTDNYRYGVKVIPDEYPVVQMQEYRDSVTGTQILLNGTAGDDYGINRVVFRYQITDAQNKQLADKSVSLKTPSGALASFQHYFDIQSLNMQPGQKVTYYVEAWDNDGVHGSKASRSEVMTYQMYSPQQLDSAINENAQQINSGLSNSAQQTQKLQKEYKDLQSKLLQNNSLDWEQRQSLQNLADKQMQLKSQLEAIKKRFEEQIQQSKQKEYSEDIQKKQEQLKEQMDNLLNKELQEQMKKLQELMQQLNKDDAFKAMQQLEQQNKLFNMDMERMQELMKKLEMQMRMEDMANKMDELAAKQMELKQQTESKAKSNEALNKEQQNLKKQLDNALSKDMKEMQELNKKMDNAMEEVQDAKQAGENAQQEMQQSSEDLQQGQNSKSGQQQQKAAQSLQQMANMMRQGASGLNIKQIQLDIKAVRQILTNLMRLSFEQEQMMGNLMNTSIASNAHVEAKQKQHRMHGNSQMIRDSLFSLSKRVFSLQATVNKETTELEGHMQLAKDNMEQNRLREAVTHQQYVMTHTNNLALMLNEMLANLMQMQSQAMQSQKQGSCSNPGGATPKPGEGKQLSDIITQQKQLGNAMQQMQSKQGNQGQQQGKGQQQGESGEGGEYGDAEQVARMAQQQAAIRKQLQELNSLLNSKGLGQGKLLQEIQKEMDRMETDLVNKKLGSELMLRQRDILTRLLESEKALREQQQDDKRSSRSAQDISRPIPPELQKYAKDRQNLLEHYKTVPPELKPYFRGMVKEYFDMIGK